MLLTGIQATIGFYISNILSNRKWVKHAFILGIILPDIDYLLAYFFYLIGSISEPFIFFQGKFTHSLFFILCIYIILMIISEVKKNSLYNRIGLSIFLGSLLHIILDIISPLSNIYFVWPLSIHFNWNLFLNHSFIEYYLLLDFLFFRLFIFNIQNKIIYNNSNNIWIYIPIRYIIKIQLWSIFILVLIILSDILVFTTVYGILYILSLITIIIITILSRDVLE